MCSTIPKKKRQQSSRAIPHTNWKREQKAFPYWARAGSFQFPNTRWLLSIKSFRPIGQKIGGMDFGWDHPFAAVELVWDRDSDVVYVAKTHRLKEATPIIHAAALRGWGKELPWAWPRDGGRETLEGAMNNGCRSF